MNKIMTTSFGIEVLRSGHICWARRLSCFFVCMASLAGCVSASEDLDASSKHQDVEPAATLSANASKATSSFVVQPRVRRTGDTVEIELQSDRPFDYGAMPPVLVVGSKAFWRSHFGADGSLNTLVFVVDATDYATLNSDAPVSFGYLDPSADFEPPSRGAKGLAKAAEMRPDQVKDPRTIGTLRRDRMEIAQ